jgi:hypothetical protein
MKEFVFQSDILVDAVRYRYAILRFTARNGKIDYAGMVAIVEEDETFEIISSIITETLEESVFFLKECGVNQFADMLLFRLNQDLNRFLN